MTLVNKRNANINVSKTSCLEIIVPGGYEKYKILV